MKNKTAAMKCFYRIVIALSLCCVSGKIFSQQQSWVDSMTLRTFKLTDLQQEFNFLRKGLEETHPGLYRYTPKELMTARLDSFYTALRDNMSYYDYYHLLSALIADVRCAHTNALPNDWQGFMNKYPRYLPFAQHIIKDRIYVTLNQTTDATIKPGYELLTINGKPVKEVLDIIYRHMWADGYNESLKRQTLNQGFFPLMYYVHVDRAAEYRLTFRTPDGKIIPFTTPALANKQAQANAGSNPVNKEILRIYGGKRQLRKLEIKKDSSIAFLKLQSFGELDGKHFDKFIEESMPKINASGVKNLVIDLRYNGGGWDSAGVFLFTYLINKPSTYYRGQHTITDSSEYVFKYSDVPKETLNNLKTELTRQPDGTFALNPQYTAGLPLQFPKAAHFNGKIYFLMNGMSASTTSEFLSAAQGNALGTFFGEESGGCHEGGNGGSFLHLTLPTTRIVVNVPLVYYKNGGTPVPVKGHGTMPDFKVSDDMELLLKGIDAQKQFLLKYIMEHP